MQEVLEKKYFGDDSDNGTIIDPTIHKDGCNDMAQMDPLKDNLRQVEKGRLDRKTGMRIPLTDKGATIVRRNLSPSKAYLDNFDKIKFNGFSDKDRKGYKVRTGARWYG